MTAPLDRPVVCPILVGRDAHLQGLERVLDEVSSGSGKTVLIAGEAGIGKSRLLGKIRERALRLGFLSIEGHCFERDRVLPYAPLLDLLRTRWVDQRSDEIRLKMGSAAPDLVKLLPEITARLSGLVASADLRPEHEKQRLFHELGQLFSGLAAAQPLLVVIEDLHWCDEASLDFLLFLARRFADHSILLLCSYRSEEADPSLVHFLAELDRGRLATELALPRLGRTEVGLMLQAICEPQQPVGSQFLDLLHTLTDGNPFFIEEVLRSLIVSPGQWNEKPIGELPIPRSVQDAVQRRTAALRPSARETLRLAAVAGRRFDFALLQALTCRDEQELLAIVKELMAAQLVVEESAEHFAFRHALTRQAIYSQLLARERKSLHLSIAETIERVYADAPDRHRADLAYHFFEAGVWAKALENAQRAGEQAQAFYAPRAAVELFTRALDAAAYQGTAPPAQLYRVRAQAYKTLGEFEWARADFEAALALARAVGDRQTAWQTLLDLGLLWASLNYARTGEYYQQALAMAQALGDPASLGHGLNRLGNWYVNAEQPLLGLRHHAEALTIFEALADRQGIAGTLDLQGMARCCSGDLFGAMATYERAVRLLRELDDRYTLVLSLALLTSSAGDGHFDPLVSDHEEVARAMRAGEEARAIARSIEWPAGEAFACAQLGQSLGARGEYGRALAEAQDACRIAGEIKHRQWLAFAHEVLGRLYLDLLALPAARHHLEQAVLLAREVGSRIWLHAASGALIATCVQQGDLRRAEAVLAAVSDLTDPPQSFGQRLLGCARVELALAQREPARALELADQVYASLVPEDSDGRRRVGPPHLGRLRGQALAALGQLAEAESVLQADVGAARARGCLPHLWRLHVALVATYRTGGRRAEAERELAAAHRIVEDVAAKVPDEPVPELDEISIREYFRQAATAHLYDPQLQHPTRLPDGLTLREIEVLRLLAVGRRNREIAAELFISVRTVEHHVANIYAKIGANRRAHATTYALHHNLVPVGELDR